MKTFLNILIALVIGLTVGLINCWIFAQITLAYSRSDYYTVMRHLHSHYLYEMGCSVFQKVDIKEEETNE